MGLSKKKKMGIGTVLFLAVAIMTTLGIVKMARSVAEDFNFDGLGFGNDEDSWLS